MATASSVSLVACGAASLWMATAVAEAPPPLSSLESPLVAPRAPVAAPALAALPAPAQSGGSPLVAADARLGSALVGPPVIGLGPRNTPGAAAAAPRDPAAARMDALLRALYLLTAGGTDRPFPTMPQE